jgi:hypothetical protein
MDRRDFQELSRLRRREARILLRAGRAEGAYYLAGYAVECALKACIAKATCRHEFPDRERTTRSYVHDLPKLLETAGLQPVLAQAQKSNPTFFRNWVTVRDWTQTSRYERTIDLGRATAFYRAIAGRGGVLQWLRQYW